MPRLVIPYPSLVILCGPAGSGKSTFAARHFPATAVVSSDQCRAMIADDEANIAVSAEAFAIFHQIIEARLRYRRLTVADSTAVRREARRALLQIARRWRVPASLVVFNIPEQTCLRWDAHRHRHVDRAAIYQHSLALQEALTEIGQEGYDQVVVLGEADLSATSVEIVPRPTQGHGAARVGGAEGLEGPR